MIDSSRSIKDKHDLLRLICLVHLLVLAACSDPIHPSRQIGGQGAAWTVVPPAQVHHLTQSPTKAASATPPAGATQVLETATTVAPAAAFTPTPPPSPTPLGCWAEGGRFEEASLRNSYTPLPLEVRVYLPPCYDQEPDRRYPVLYLIHGQNYHHDQWDRLGADETADRLIAAGDAPPFIIVLPRDRLWAQPSEDGFGQAFLEDLIPWVSENFRTLEGRQHRAVGGLSRGAAWAVHLGLSRWDLFGAVGAHSLPVFWEDTSRIRGWLEAIPSADLPRIYMDTGEKDYLIESTLWFEQVLTEKAIPHEWHLFTGYHEEAYWESHLEQYLRWYTAGW